ncbi:hypothetical protein BC829DRAFT_207947 [Chytridium lagenaria]|nr:hypothetical protein BC829DRAFT_207947 [Chytridium lagenaria]
MVVANAGSASVGCIAEGGKTCGDNNNSVSLQSFFSSSDSINDSTASSFVALLATHTPRVPRHSSVDTQHQLSLFDSSQEYLFEQQKTLKRNHQTSGLRTSQSKISSTGLLKNYRRNALRQRIIAAAAQHNNTARLLPKRASSTGVLTTRPSATTVVAANKLTVGTTINATVAPTAASNSSTVRANNATHSATPSSHLIPATYSSEPAATATTTLQRRQRQLLREGLL